MPGEDSWKVMDLLYNTDSVPDAFSKLDEFGKDGFVGLAQNFMLTDNSGNIGYYLIMPVPIRKDKTPYIGARVLDGTTSAYDWEPLKNAPLTELPRSLNPKKGFLVAANNR